MQRVLLEQEFDDRKYLNTGTEPAGESIDTSSQR
jgi:hypothetical protein